MLKTYLRRDLAGLVKMSKEYFQGGDAALAQRFQSRIIDKRNLKMVERLQPLLATGEYICWCWGITPSGAFREYYNCSKHVDTAL